jgi:hypothetical protein
MDIEHIFTQFARGEILKGSPYEKELVELYAIYQTQLKGGGCKACRRRAITRNFRDKVQQVLDKYK